jgi:hypothetical protein
MRSHFHTTRERFLFVYWISGLWAGWFWVQMQAGKRYFFKTIINLSNMTTFIFFFFLLKHDCMFSLWVIWHLQSLAACTRVHFTFLTYDNMFCSARTIIRPSLQNFQNKAHKSAIIIHTMGSHMCCSSYYKVKLYRTLSKIWNVIAGGCEVQVFKLRIDNIKNIRYKYRLLTL